jgi:hypothetical protein
MHRSLPCAARAKYPPDRYPSAMALIGRERELAAWGPPCSARQRGNRAGWHSVGPVGIGMTRLLDELSGRLADMPDVVSARRAATSRAAACLRAIRSALEPATGRARRRAPARGCRRVAHDLARSCPASGGRLAGGRGAGAAAAPGARPARRPRAGEPAGHPRAPRRRWRRLPDHRGPRARRPGTRELDRALLRVSRRCRWRWSQLPPRRAASRPPSVALRARARGQPDRGEAGAGAARPRRAAGAGRAAARERPSLSFMAAIMEGSRGNPLVASQLVAASEPSSRACACPTRWRRSSMRAWIAGRPAVVRVLRLLAAPAGR